MYKDKTFALGDHRFEVCFGYNFRRFALGFSFDVCKSSWDFTVDLAFAILGVNHWNEKKNNAWFDAIKVAWEENFERENDKKEEHANDCRD